MAISALRRARIRRISALRSKGLSSSEIGKKLNLAPSTVRDYERDPFRQRARKRQRILAVEGVNMPADGQPIVAVKKETKRWHPHKGVGRAHNLARGRQMRAVIGSYAKRGRP